MRQKEIALNIQPIKPIGMDEDEDHPISSYDTPLRDDAFILSDEEKIENHVFAMINFG